jgi:acetyl-CoA C-acetyltransferase/acetyl-CoA acyltransferase 2
MPHKLAKDIVFLSAKRTAFGTFNGKLTRHSATDLGVHASQAALQQAGVRPDEVDHVIFGNVMQTSPDAIYLARHVGLKAGVPQEVGAVTVNRLCGSGFQSLVDGARMLLLGEGEVILAGGAESMSQAPFTLRGARTGLPLFGKNALNDYIEECLTDTYAGAPMAITAENLGARFEVSREECDKYALVSQERWAAAHKAGHFQQEIAPLDLKGKQGPERFDADEHPRATTLEKLASLKPVFKKDGLVTAGNASGINDGAGAVVMSTMQAAEKRGQQPLGRLVSWGIAGCDPQIMGIGPVYAARKALAMAGMELSQMDLVEINEAFAAQYLAVERQLGLRREITNVNGGAIAIGHPLAASGTRLTATMLYELKRRGARYGLASACIGGGQGIAVIVEAL